MSSPLPLAVADRADRPVTLCYSVHARAEPGVMPRVVELFAKRGLVPHRWFSTVAGPSLMIEVQMAGMAPDLGDYIARTMRQIVGVEAVLTSEIHQPG